IAEMAIASMDEWIQNSVQTTKDLPNVQVNLTEHAAIEKVSFNGQTEAERLSKPLNELSQFDKKNVDIAESHSDVLEAKSQSDLNVSKEAKFIGENSVLRASEVSVPHMTIPVTVGAEAHLSSGAQPTEKVEVVHARQLVQEVQTIMTE